MSDFNKELDQLLHISHVVGCNPWLVQSGGGNTSVKTPDRKKMVIKASGTPLGKMTPQKGWVCVDTDTIGNLFSQRDIRDLDSSQREKKILSLLNDSIITPQGSRPSVETPLHALLDTVVIHSHPVVASALVCHPEGEAVLQKLFGNRDNPPVWIPYIDPGATLAFEVFDRLESIEKERGCLPDIIVQQNHGVFVAAPTPTECVLKHQEFLQTVEDYFQGLAPDGFDDQTGEMVRTTVADFMKEEQEDEFVLRLSQSTELIHAAQTEYFSVFTGALSPDHVVYTGPNAVIVDSDCTAEQLKTALKEFKNKHNMYARLILVKGMGMCVVAASEAKVTAAEELAKSAVRAAFLSQNKVKFLAYEQAYFIMNWEAEHYRAKQT